MSLLLNEDFTAYTLRHAYLTSIPDGVGERLINLNTAVLNNPAFRTAGWLPDLAAVKRCYSPPIPTTGAGEYFRVPARARGISLEDDAGADSGGMITGERRSEDTIGIAGKRRQRTRKEQLEEEDSSDLSDEDSEGAEKSAAQGIKFNKMPVRGESPSSPVDTLRAARQEREEEGPELMITSLSRPPPDGVVQGLRRGSLGQVEAVKQRARRDTTTSSEMSSENELDPNTFNRKLPGRPGGKKSVMLAERIQEADHAEEEAGDGDSDLEDEDVGEASDLSDEFEVDEDTAGSPELLGIGIGGNSEDFGSPVKPPPDMPPAVTPAQNQHSPRKQATKDTLALPKLARLPSGRPISSVQPPSLITMALKGPDGGGEAAGGKPFQRFADLCGKGEASPLWIKIYAPFSNQASDAIQVPIRRLREGNPVTVSELIGLALWRYSEEEYEPPLEKPDEININRWDLRIVEDEEVDFDFPALVRTRPVTDFTSNNNRPPQRRARDKPWDEFGLVKASDEGFKENEQLTPQIGTGTTSTISTPQVEQTQAQAVRPATAIRTDTDTSMSSRPLPSRSNPITGPSLAPAALRKETGNLLDAPQNTNPQSTPKTGAPKTVNVHFTDPQSFATSNIAVATTSDSYIAELFDHACKRLGNLDKGLYVFKVHGTQTVAPTDRTVEALGDRLHLDLVRRRFIGAGSDGVFGLGMSGSPGSSSPNAPLDLAGERTPPGAASGAGGVAKRKFKPGAAKVDQINQSTLNLSIGLGLDLAGGRRYNVLRRQPLSFAPSHPRTLIITPEYLQILPAAPDSLAAPTGKVTNVPMTSVVGVKVSRKHPKMVRVLVFREKETKRYDFECSSKGEAEEIVNDLRRALEGIKGKID